jgi:hypothetical protein
VIISSNRRSRHESEFRSVGQVFCRHPSGKRYGRLLLAALPNFEPEVRATDQRILLFWMLYTAPICIAQVTVFLVVRWLARK